MWPEKSATRSVAVGSFPSLTLIAISQAEAALTISVFLVSAMNFRAARGSAGASESHQSKEWVSSRARKECYSQVDNSLIGRGSKNSGPTHNFPFNDPGWR